MSVSRTFRRTATLLGPVTVLATLGLGSAAPAHAAVGIICSGHGTLTWGASLPTAETAENWTAHTDFTGCSGVGVDKDATAPKSLDESGSETADCTGPISGDNTSNVTIVWADNSTGHGTNRLLAADELHGNPTGTFQVTITDGSHHVGQTMLETPQGIGGSCGETSVDYTETAVLAAF
ncbi:hypothetical protein [Streptacidiphilus sp. P02-A3a]|uniref:hypothetical protein n=1 Tax=Streptacidiphilus sp. P02-A3a TaxID=2704468 RepID=UPI0015F8A48F|nr:hypothetical protein [Streptacidiphilus sp. P02-A3a]QMU69686.1 hypothetical protein GXP74_17005 [Streptacidiphilus sp. P02-A3a]